MIGDKLTQMDPCSPSVPLQPCGCCDRLFYSPIRRQQIKSKTLDISTTKLLIHHTRDKQWMEVTKDHLHKDHSRQSRKCFTSASLNNYNYENDRVQWVIDLHCWSKKLISFLPFYCCHNEDFCIWLLVGVTKIEVTHA
jgi:hypothetical protein